MEKNITDVLLSTCLGRRRICEHEGVAFRVPSCVPYDGINRTKTTHVSVNENETVGLAELREQANENYGLPTPQDWGINRLVQAKGQLGLQRWQCSCEPLEKLLVRLKERMNTRRQLVEAKCV